MPNYQIQTGDTLNIPSTETPITPITPITPTTSTTQTTNQPINLNQFQSEDPIRKFNLAIWDMLRQAQGTAGNESLYAQQTALQRAAIGRQAEITPEELRVLSPQQQAAIRGGKISALEPEIDAISAKIKSQNAQLQNFESILGTVREIGLDLVKITPSQEVLQGYVGMIEAGGSPTAVPEEVRASVLSKVDWASWAEAKKPKETTPTSYREWELAGKPGTYADWAKKGGTTGQDLSEVLSPYEAQALRVPYGTTKGQAMGMGITPLPSGLRSKQADQLLKLQGVRDTADQISSLITEIGPEEFGPKGRAAGLIRKGLSLIGLAPEITAYEAIRKASIGPLARAISGEVGVLTDRDIARAAELLPNIGDSAEEVRRKLKNLYDTISNREEAAQSAFGGGQISQDIRQEVIQKGYDYDAMKSRGYSDEEIKQAIGL